MKDTFSHDLTAESAQGSGKTPACACEIDTTCAHPTKNRAMFVVRVATIAALNAALTLVAMLSLSGLAWGPIQFRVSEAICVLALFCPEAIWGLTLGCAISNIINVALSGAGIMGLLDIVFGSLATFVGAWFTWRMRKHPALALLGPVVANAFIVAAYLPLILQGLGFYTIPFTEISLEGSYIFMYAFGAVTIGIGEAAVLYIVGLPLYSALKRAGFEKFIAPQEA